MVADRWGAAHRHAACGGLTAPPYHSLRSLGGAAAPGSGLRPARPVAGLATRRAYPVFANVSRHSQTTGPASRRRARRRRGSCARRHAAGRWASPGASVARACGNHPWGGQRWGAALDPHRRPPAAPGCMCENNQQPEAGARPLACVAARRVEAYADLASSENTAMTGLHAQLFSFAAGVRTSATCRFCKLA